MEGLLNLENLTKEERNQILLVLRKDDLIRQTEDRKISQLKQEIQALRMRSVLRDGDDLSKICARCHSELGMLFNRGEVCPKCHFRVCKLCQESLLNGTWLCILCYKQRQLKWFMGDWEPGKPTRWPSGADLVKASLRKSQPTKRTGNGNVGDNIDQSKDEIQNGSRMHNGTAHPEKKGAERVEFPRESDQRKLAQLFDNFKLPKKNESPPETKHVKRVSSRKYSDSESEDSDSSSGNNELVDTVKQSPYKIANSRKPVPEPPPDYDDDDDDVDRENVTKGKRERRKGVTAANNTNSSSTKTLNRTHSDDSDQTLLSDDVPFSKSSTETQIKVDIHSDSPKSSSKDECKIPKSKSDLLEKPKQTKSMRQSATDVIMALKFGKRKSPEPNRSLSLENVNKEHPGVSRQQKYLQYQAGRSPSPYSFDSIPSSHANSPLPQKRLADLAAENNTSKESDTDSMSHVSGTDFPESSSGADDFTVEELSKVRFRRISKKSTGGSSSASPSPPPQLDDERVHSGEGRDEGGQHKGKLSKTQTLSDRAEVFSKAIITHSMGTEALDISNLLHIDPDISLDLSISEIEKDCLESSGQYDISTIAQEAFSLLTLPESDEKTANLKTMKKSPKLKRRSGNNAAEKAKSESESKESGQTGAVAETEYLSSSSKAGEVIHMSVPQVSPRKKRMLPSIPADLEVREQETISPEQTSIQNLGTREEGIDSSVEFDVRNPHRRGAKDEEIQHAAITKVALDDSGRHDSFDSLLQSSVLNESKLKIESVDSFELSPMTPISPGKVEAKPMNYRFAFGNDSVFNEESPNLSKDKEDDDDFDDIFAKAVSDLQSGKLAEEHGKTKRRKILIKEEERHQFVFRVGETEEEESSTASPVSSPVADTVEISKTKKENTIDKSMLWHFEDTTVKEDHDQLFGNSGSEGNENFAENRAQLLKTVVRAMKSNTSIESDSLSIIPEELECESSIESSRSSEHEAELQRSGNHEAGHPIDSVTKANGQSKNLIYTTITEEKISEQAAASHDIPENKNSGKAEKVSVSDESTRNARPASVSQIAFSASQIAVATNSAESRGRHVSLESDELNTSSAATEKLVSSLQAQLSLDDCDVTMETNAEKALRHNDADDLEISGDSPNSSGTLTKTESPLTQDMSNDKPRKRLKSKQLVQDWLESEMGSKSSSKKPDNKITDSSHLPQLFPASNPEYQTSAYNQDSDQQTRQTLTDSAQSSTHIPSLQLLEDDSEKSDSGPSKLSPRASSEGSGSFEDSGLVSGASTENTPEHRRTGSIQSQLSVPSSTVSNITDKSSEEADIDDLVASHRSHGTVGRGNLLSTIAGSRESILSVYSNAGDVDYGKIPITGEILLGLDYNYRTGTLELLVKQCKELAPADPKRKRSDPYVKAYLLPDKTRGGKRKTRILKNTLNPIFEQTLRYLISKSELENRTLSVTVWHNDRFGRNDFLGEVTINFDYFRFGDSAPKWYPLQEKKKASPSPKVEVQPTTNLTYKGDLFLSLKYVPADKVSKDDVVVSPSKKKFKKGKTESTPSKGQLHVTIKEAKNLTAIRTGGYSDPFVKGYLLPDKHRTVKQKTPVVRRNCNPVWNHTFIFDDVQQEDLKDRCLELTVWDYDKITSNEFLGGLRLNQGLGRSAGKAVDWMDAHGEEISLWQAMMDRPNIPIDGALILRPNMEKRKY